jgi:hypothetical protein
MNKGEWQYIPKFLSAKESDELYDRCLLLPWEREGEPWQGEEKFAVHYGVSYSKNGGPREKEIPEIPGFLRVLADRIAAETKVPVNYVQCHRASPEHKVRKHPDPSGMVVPMIVVGPEICTNFSTLPINIALAKTLAKIVGKLADLRDEQLEKDKKLSMLRHGSRHPCVPDFVGKRETV